MTSVGFEPTPVKTTALTLRLRPLGHEVLTCYYLPLQQYTIAQQQIILHTHLLHLHLHLHLHYRTPSFSYRYGNDTVLVPTSTVHKTSFFIIITERTRTDLLCVKYNTDTYSINHHTRYYDADIAICVIITYSEISNNKSVMSSII